MFDSKNNQRKLSSKMSIEDQIATLRSLIKNPPENSRVCEFGPDLAHYILENINVNNRPRKSSKIIQYRSDMQADNWSLTGETVKFGTDGFLKDGQNRLAACMQAGVPFTTHAIFGIDPATFHHMDTGKNRDANDVLSIMGVKNAKHVSLTIKMILAWQRNMTRNKTSVTNQEVKDAYLKRFDVDLLQESVKWADTVYKQTRFPRGHIATTYYMAVENGRRAEIEAFLEALMRQTGPVTSGPIKLQSHLTKLRGNREIINEHHYAVLLSRALYCFINNKRMTNDMLTVRIDDKRMRMSA